MSSGSSTRQAADSSKIRGSLGVRLKVLYVYMNGLEVGKLQRLSGGGLAFVYTQSWLSSNLSRPISLSLPLQSKQYTNDAVANYFDNLLPDNLQIRQRIQAQFQTPTTQTFDLLAAIGSDCVGALQLSARPEPANVREIKSRPVSETEIASILKGYASAPLGMNRKRDEFRISIAGAQEKTALLKLGGGWHRPEGSTPTSHILKLPMGLLPNGLDLKDSCENELVCLEIARAYGLPVANAAIEFFEDTKALVVERFDRRWSENKTWLIRLPQEDFCQVMGVPGTKKYEKDGGPEIESILGQLRGSERALEDRENFFRSQILFWLLAAPDGHAKNFSIYIETGGNFRLTPLYDVLSAYPLIEQKQMRIEEVELAMALRGKSKHYKLRDIQPRHFVATARRAGMDCQSAEQMLRNMLTQAPDVASQVIKNFGSTIPEDILTSILSGMVQQAEKNLKLMLEF